METWPSYAGIGADNYVLDRGSAVNRTPMSDGMVKQLRVRTRVLVTRNYSALFDTLAHYNSFISWYNDDIDAGADWFNWTDPVTSTVKSARIVNKLGQEKPRMGLLSKWEIAITVETYE